MSFGPPPLGYQPPALPAWTAPIAVEHALYEAKLRGDWLAYYDTSARTRSTSKCSAPGPTQIPKASTPAITATAPRRPNGGNSSRTGCFRRPSAGTRVFAGNSGLDRTLL